MVMENIKEKDFQIYSLLKNEEEREEETLEMVASESIPGVTFKAMKAEICLNWKFTLPSEIVLVAYPNERMLPLL